MPQPKLLDRAVQTTNTWLNEVGRGLGTDSRTAWHALAAVLHTLRDRVSVDEARHFGAQLPLIIRGLFFDQWGPRHRLPRIRTKAQFVERVEVRLNNDFIDPEDAINVVFGVLLQHPTGEIQKILRTLPQFVRDLAPAVERSPSDSAFEWE